MTVASLDFQRYLNNVFDNLRRECKILLYVDDILIVTQTIRGSLVSLREIFRLQNLHKLHI